MSTPVVLSAEQSQIFEKITSNDNDGFKIALAQLKGTVNFVDENGMSPLQHACYKGNKTAVQMLLDLGADPNFSQHGANYTNLHFAALSGNVESCLLLLNAGAKISAQNAVNRTAAQMAAFVGNHSCVATINNFIPKSDLEYYTKVQGIQTEPYLPPALLDNFHKFVIEFNLHPVRLALVLQQSGNLTKHLDKLKKVLTLMTEREMRKQYDINELLAFKYHYFGWIVSELIRAENSYKEKPDSKKDFVELFIRRALKENKLGQLDYLDFTIRDCVREFPFRECTIFRQVVTQLASKDCPPALVVLKNCINGHRGFVEDESLCSTCGNEKPDKKCSKCKQVQYCDRECQRLHWFLHKKACPRLIALSSNLTSTNAASKSGARIDENELRAQLQNLVTS